MALEDGVIGEAERRQAMQFNLKHHFHVFAGKVGKVSAG
jgi:hypothetical protein